MHEDPSTRRAVGRPPADERAPLTNLKLPQLPYPIGDRVGSGGNAAVHKVTIDDQVWAIKFPLTDEAFPSFKYEGELQSANYYHPNINPIHSYGTADNGLPYVISRLIDPSENLAQFLTRTGLRAAKQFSFSNNQIAALRLFAQVLGAADFLLSNGVVFRDFKNANVLVERDPLIGEYHARLTDFGLAEMRSSRGELRPPRTTIEGTQPFLAPELFHFDSEGHFPAPYSKLTEMYALGVMLYEVVTGSYPITFGKDEIVAVKVVGVPPDPPSKFRTGIPSEL